MSDEKNEPTGNRVETTPAVVHGMDGRFARVTPSLYLDSGVCVAFRTSTGEATINAITFTAEEWDALYAAGNRALGRPALKGRRLITRADGDEVSERLSMALGSYGITWGSDSLTAIDGCRRDAVEVQLRVATVGIYPGRDGWEIES